MKPIHLGGVGYYVVHPGGQRYGPAEVATLNQWAAEGRLLPDTPLIDEVTAAQIRAQDVPGLFFPIHAGAGGPGAPTIMPGPAVGTPLGGGPPAGHYPRPYAPVTPGLNASPLVTTSYIASVLGVILICCAPYVTVLAGLVAVGLAWGANSADPRRAKPAVWVGIGVLALGVAGIFGFVILSQAMTGGR